MTHEELVVKVRKAWLTKAQLVGTHAASAEVIRIVVEACADVALAEGGKYTPHYHEHMAKVIRKLVQP